MFYFFIFNVLFICSTFMLQNKEQELDKENVVDNIRFSIDKLPEQKRRKNFVS